MIGSDVYVANHKFRLRQGDDNFIVFRAHETTTKTVNFLGAFSLLFNLAIQEEPFLMPDLFQCGIVQSFLIIFVIFLLSLISFYIYFKTWVFGNTFSYGGISSIAMTKTVTLFTNTILLFSYICITLSFAVQIPHRLIDLLTIADGFPSFLLNKWFLYYLTSFLFVFPSLFNNSIASFVGISAVGNIALLISVISFFCGTFITDVPKIEPNLFSSCFQRTSNLINTISLVFFLNPLIYLVAINTNRPTAKNIKAIVLTTNFVNFIINIAVGVVGVYIDQKTEFIFDIFSRKNVFSIIGKIGVIVRIETSNIYYIYIISNKLCELILKGSEKWKLAVVTSGIVVIVFNAIILFSILDNVFQIIRVAGSVFMCFINFGFPAIIFLRLFQFSSKYLGATCIVLIILTTTLCAIIICSGYYNFTK